jgi:hypothetical protein
MNRPLMQHGVGQLEQLFAASKTDQKVLKQLENELRYRQVPRAIALLAEVQAALYASPGGTKQIGRPQAASPKAPVSAGESGIPVAAPIQPPLWVTPPVASRDGESKQVGQAPAAGAPQHTSTAPKSEKPFTNVPAATEPTIEAPLVTLADAFKLFKATSSSTWESIEQTRRQAVQASSPARVAGMSGQQQKEVREVAKRFNVAYEVLSRARAQV